MPAISLCRVRTEEGGDGGDEGDGGVMGVMGWSGIRELANMRDPIRNSKREIYPRNPTLGPSSGRRPLRHPKAAQMG